MYQLFGRRSKKSSSRLKKRDLEYIDPDGQDLEYIEDEEYESNEEYYEDEEYESDEKYYEDEEYDEDEGYYEDEEYDEDEGYYEDEEYDEDEGYYEDEEYDEDEEYYQDKEYDTDKKYYGPKTRGFRRILTKITNMSMVDRMIAVTGIGVLLVAVFTGSLYINAKNKEKQIAAFAEIGAQTEHITVIGERGLIAVADVQMARNLAAEFENLEKEENEESEEEAAGNVKVLMNLSSIQKDLKIKFTNEKSGKLIPNVPFEVEVKGPDNKKYILRDDDKDGIIYQKDIEAGKYRVSMVENADTKDYIISTSAATITVRDTIEYKKVDVSDEIKKESQINVKAEDTKVNETAVESVNADTVEWVESTKTPISGTENSIDQYEEISKSNITDPGKTAKINNTMSDWFISDMSTAHYQLLVDESPTPTETPTATPTESPTADPTESPTVTPTVTPAATPTETPTETPTATPTETPTATPTATPAATPAATPTATPTATPKNVQNDTKSKLKDNSGKQIYIKDSSGKYVEAVYADYYKSSKFYKKTTTTTTVEYKYTGWQQIDGKTYFFDKNGNKVTGEQVIQGAKYNFASDGSLSQSSGHLGIDVSKWNGNIDWNAVKNSGISYVIIRCGYRGSTTGALVEDPVFKSNIKGATAAGIKVGIYFFTQATNEVEAVEEASMVLGLIKGYKISYPVFLDVEATEGNNGRADGISKEARTAVCKAFCQTIQNSGYTAGIYANKHWFTSYINTASLTQYKIWLAQYAAAPTYTATKYDMWQYSSKGSVSGISGNVDMNISYLGY